ncbi:MAG: terL [Sedimentibacter sp.]|nr:terL [Sedimentibacter sp.]
MAAKISKKSKQNDVFAELFSSLENMMKEDDPKEMSFGSALNQMANFFETETNKQIDAGETFDEIWEFEPVDSYTFCTSEKYLNLGSEIYPVVLQDLADTFPGDPKNMNPEHSEIIFDEAIGSGKSFKLSILASYMAYKLLCLRNPQKFFKLAPGSKIAIMNMSVSASQAKRVVFGEIKNKIDYSPWFQDHYPPNPRIRSELQFDPSPESMNKREMGRIYKNIYIIPGSSSGMAPLGYNLFCGIIDEATLWRDTENKDYVEDVYDIIRRRVTSRFMDKGLIVLGGSPMYSTDFLERRIKDVKDRELKNVMVRRRSHWHAKYPDYKGPMFYFHLEDCKVFKTEEEMLLDRDKVAKRAGDNWENAVKLYDDQIHQIPMMYYDDFHKNPEGSKRDLGGWPSDAISSFIENQSIIEENINMDRVDPVRAPFLFKKWFRPKNRKAWHVIHIDLGITGDACGISMGHPEGFTEEGGVLVWIDFIMRIQGSKEEPIQIENIREMIYRLSKLGFPIGLITMDGFQSVDNIQILRKKGYNTEYLSLDRSLLPYEEWKAALNEHRLNMYEHETYIKEAKKLEKIKNKKIDHPRGGSKDCTDAVGGVTYNCNIVAHWDPPTDEDDESEVYSF